MEKDPTNATNANVSPNCVEHNEEKSYIGHLQASRRGCLMTLTSCETTRGHGVSQVMATLPSSTLSTTLQHLFAVCTFRQTLLPLYIALLYSIPIEITSMSLRCLST